MVQLPKKIQVSKSKATLNIEWEDGAESEYPLAGLRSRGSPDLLLIPLEDGRSTVLERVDLVGNYAIQLVWGDGHSYGIF
jgi:DUF971 family protein